MSQDAIERLLGRLITDESFRRCFSGCCLDRICRQEGYKLTQGERQMVGRSTSRYWIPFPHGLTQACSGRQEYRLATVRDAVFDVAQNIVRC